MLARSTVQNHFRQWLDHIENTRQLKTYQLYEALTRLYIVPYIGRMQVRAVKREHIRTLLARIRPLTGSRTVQLVFRLLRQVFSEALEDGYITVHPCVRRDKPHHECKERRVLSLEEARRLLNKAKEGDYYLLFLLSLTTGMRQGEIFGLRWDAVDLQSSSIYVRVSLTRDRANQAILSAPKASRKRRIDVGNTLNRLLEQHKRRCLSETWVFTDIGGEPLHKDRFTRSVFHPLLRDAGIERIRFHDLRHTSATLALSSGINVKVLAERLGHSSAKMTLDVYTRALPTLQRDAATRMERMIVDDLIRPRKRSTKISDIS